MQGGSCWVETAVDCLGGKTLETFGVVFEQAPRLQLADEVHLGKVYMG